MRDFNFLHYTFPYFPTCSTIFLYFFDKQKKYYCKKNPPLCFTTPPHMHIPLQSPLHTNTHSYSPNIIIISHLGPTNPSTQKSFPLLLHWRISSTYLLVKYNLYLTLGNPKRVPPITTSLVELQAHTTVPHSWLDLHKRASGWHALGPWLTSVCQLFD